MSRAPAGTTSPAWHVAAWAIALVGWTLVVAALVGAVALGRVPDHLTYWVMDLVVGLLYGLAVLVLLPRTRHPAGWILALTAWGCALAALADVWELRGPDVAGYDAAYVLRFWTWVPGLYATVAVLPFLVVRPPARWGRPLMALGVVAAVLATLPGLTIDLRPTVENPTAIHSAPWQQLLQLLGPWPDRAVTALGAVAIAWLVIAVRRGDPDARPGLRWLLAGQIALVAAMVAFLTPMPESWASPAAEFSGALLLLAQAFLPAALLTLVLSRRLWGVDATVDRATLWTVMTVTVALGYLIVVALFGWALPGDSGLDTGLAVAVIGLGFSPLRRLLQRRVDRLVYGAGTNPALVWSRVNDATDHDLASVAESLRGSLRLASVHLETADEGGTVARQISPGETRRDLVSRGRTVGALFVRPRTGERLDRRTAAMLDQVAGLLATVLDLARANDALDAARSRLVEIRHEERRVLRRDLHDGLGPALAGIRLGITASLNLRDQDPDAADRMLAELATEVSRRSEDIRHLSRTLLPPALDDGDLVSALGGLVERFTDDDLTVSVTADPELELPPHVQIALYHVASEAVLNVHRHARATRCDVVLKSRAPGGVLLIISDDGARSADPAVAGVGLRSMRERAAELGGDVEIRRPESGGTRVTVRLPDLRP